MPPLGGAGGAVGELQPWTAPGATLNSSASGRTARRTLVCASTGPSLRSCRNESHAVRFDRAPGSDPGSPVELMAAHALARPPPGTAHRPWGGSTQTTQGPGRTGGKTPQREEWRAAQEIRRSEVSNLYERPGGRLEGQPIPQRFFHPHGIDAAGARLDQDRRQVAQRLRPAPCRVETHHEQRRIPAVTFHRRGETTVTAIRPCTGQPVRGSMMWP